MGGGDGADVEKVDGEEANGGEEIDSSHDEYGEERRKREEEEGNISDETRLVNKSSSSVRTTMINEDTYESNDNTRDEEGTTQDAVEADVSVAGFGEGDDDGEDVGGAIAERKESDAGNGGRELEDVGQALQGGTEVNGSGVT